MSSAKMATNAAVAPPKNELRQTFETAIAQIQRGGKPLSRSKTPIFVRTTEKRALTEAARALAQLWNISPTLIR
jgi:hypothetical protein